MSGLLLDALSVSVGGRRLFAPLSLHVPRGEVATLMGPSGCGKSSLLAAICGTLDPALSAAGRVSLDGRPLDGLPPERRRIGILFQDDLLFPHLSVGANLAFGLPPGLKRAERRARVEAALRDAELPGFAERDPATLSGGQRARVALMRALLAEPRALLLDEPFGRLDAPLRARFRAFVLGHAAARGLPVLLVTHDPAEAAGRVVRLAPEAEADAAC
ncbi:MAG: ATP-binding cassette domain-containing protein [Acetobacteraceae bacterium]|nr:ATP-binding cassette domain-containing protein [Acetobacteraceae bacterium]MCX7685992.1 ATP-binding cassette domain-containing protein [Acetobacteraceae bacterium]MDW8397526.1 ATP-binding cassette domain-containing protein [Acetobacteraceae bacterium]